MNPSVCKKENTNKRIDLILSHQLVHKSFLLDPETRSYPFNPVVLKRTP